MQSQYGDDNRPCCPLFEWLCTAGPDKYSSGSRPDQQSDSLLTPKTLFGSTSLHTASEESQQKPASFPPINASLRAPLDAGNSSHPLSEKSSNIFQMQIAKFINRASDQLSHICVSSIRSRPCAPRPLLRCPMTSSPPGHWP